MVDRTMKEIQRHGDVLFPVAAYEWFASEENNLELECHKHEEWEFFMIVEGRALVSIDGEKQEMAAGDLAIFPGGSLHMAHAVHGKPFRYRAIVFHTELMFGCGDIVQTKYITPLIDHKLLAQTFLLRQETGGEVVLIFEKLFRMIKECPPVYELFSKAYLYELLGIVFSLSDLQKVSDYDSNCSVRKIKESISFIHGHYATPITVAYLSQMANMSQGHFSRLFKRFTAKSPIDYVIGVRLSKACELLRETDDKLIHIAMDTGFNSLSYFIRVFDIHFGCSPSQYRKSNGLKSIAYQ